MGKGNVVVKVGRESLQFWREGKAGGFSLELAPAQVSQEIKNADKYAEILNQKVAEMKLGAAKAVVVLSNEVLYWQTESAAGGRVNLGRLRDFLAKLPLEPEKVASSYYAGRGELGVVAVNRELFEVLTRGLRDLGWEIVAVVPEVVVGEVDEGNWKGLFGNKKKLVGESGFS